MTIAQQVFLYAAEEKSITKAAKKAFITQQCASSHIKNLEKQYGTLLFTRKPVFALTPAGEYLLSSLYRLNILEREIDDGMKEIGSGMSGILRLGINPTRARILIPSILLQCKALIPGLLGCGEQDLLLWAIDLCVSCGRRSLHYAEDPVSAPMREWQAPVRRIRAYKESASRPLWQLQDPLS